MAFADWELRSRAGRGKLYRKILIQDISLSLTGKPEVMVAKKRKKQPLDDMRRKKPQDEPD